MRMKAVKRFAALIMALMTLALSLAACGTTVDTPADTAQAESYLPEPAESARATPPSDSPDDTQAAAESLSPTPTATPAPTSAPTPTPEPEMGENYDELLPEEENTVNRIHITINGASFTATLENNEAANTLAGMLPLTLSLHDYGGFEKVGSLGTSLPTANTQTTTSAGDIVLYQGSQIVMFYGSNSWSYTRLARVDDLTGWEEALGSGDVTVTLSLG